MGAMTMNMFLCSVLMLGVFATLFLFALGGIRQDRARKAFWRYLAAARAADMEKEFMMRLDSVSAWGDPLEKTIQTWGAGGIRRVYEETVARR